MLMEHFNIKLEHLSLFPMGSDLELIEYVLHELAHAFTMGFMQMPKLLPAAIETTLARYSATTCDSLEVDTSFVTHHAMARLGLVKEADQAKFAAKCADALSSNRYRQRQHYVLDEMEFRIDDTALQDASNNLIIMLRAPWKIVLATYSLPDDYSN
jgi:hypothetical protein